MAGLNFYLNWGNFKSLDINATATGVYINAVVPGKNSLKGFENYICETGDSCLLQ